MVLYSLTFQRELYFGTSQNDIDNHQNGMEIIVLFLPVFTVACLVLVRLLNSFLPAAFHSALLFLVFAIQFDLSSTYGNALQEEYVHGDGLGKLDCGHDFHHACIKQWLVQKNSCPICKKMALAVRDR